MHAQPVTSEPPVTHHQSYVMEPALNNPLYAAIKAILTEARQSAYRAVNFTMLQAYWEIGKQIVEHEQGGNEKPRVWECIIKRLIPPSYH